jgi:hypothetical protein
MLWPLHICWPYVSGAVCTKHTCKELSIRKRYLSEQKHKDLKVMLSVIIRNLCNMHVLSICISNLYMHWAYRIAGYALLRVIHRIQTENLFGTYKIASPPHSKWLVKTTLRDWCLSSSFVHGKPWLECEMVSANDHLRPDRYTGLRTPTLSLSVTW